MRLFLSYSRYDTEAIIPVADSLKAAGHEVLPSLELKASTGIDDSATMEIAEAILLSDVVLAILSPGSTARVSSATREIIYAQSRGKIIIPVIFQDTEIPLNLVSMGYIDIRDDPVTGVKRILEVLDSEMFEGVNNNQIRFDSHQSQDARRILSNKAPLARIFIAYSHKQYSLAKELYDLFTKSGRAVFYDAKIKAGATWRQTIQKALDDATHVVVIWTPDVTQSDEVEREVSYALAERKIIIPILSKEIPKLPYHMHGLHYIVLDDDLTRIETDLLKAIDQYKSDEDIWQ